MADAFISYRRKPSAALAQLIQEKLRNRHHLDAYVDTTRIDNTQVQFPERLMQAIADAPVFICLLGHGTLESEWVRQEIQHAFHLRKRCIPVFQEGYLPVSQPDYAIEYLLKFDGVSFFDEKGIYVDAAVEQIAVRCVPYKTQNPRVRKALLFMAVLFIITVLTLIISPSTSLLSPNPIGTFLNGTTEVVLENSVPGITQSPRIGVTDSPSDTQFQTFTPVTFVATTPSLLLTNQIIPSEESHAQTTEQTHVSLPQTSTETLSADDRIATDTQNRYETLESQRLAQGAAMIAAMANSAIASSTPDPLQQAYTQASNYDYERGNIAWTPVTYQFSGVTMVLVPAGCFTMGNGSTFSGFRHQQCLDKPFWIDQTEVTIGQYHKFIDESSSNTNVQYANHPRSFSWIDAYNFCNLRGARLPTEREWEYAARGPDSYQYPWGNGWHPDYVVWEQTDNSVTQSSEVGSIPEGASWVGALDMSGNVWEWVNTIYATAEYGEYDMAGNRGWAYSYPYDPNDGREQFGDWSNFRHIFRGGAWDSFSEDHFRSATRAWESFGMSARMPYSIGVRCVFST